MGKQNFGRSEPSSHFIVRICEFDGEKKQNGDDDDSSPPMRITKRAGRFQASLSLKGDALLSLKCVDEISEPTDDQQKWLENIALCNYDWMPISKYLLAFNNSHPLSFVRHNNANECTNFLMKSFGIYFDSSDDLNAFQLNLKKCKIGKTKNDQNIVDQPLAKKRKHSNNGEANSSTSEFDTRTEQGSASQYFQFYGSLFQQQNMLQDYTRTATYQRAIHENWEDFRDKVVLDVGAGTGILSFFAAQAGAKRVYAVEASSMAVHCKALVSANGFDGVIVVIPYKIEEVELPEQVDVIVSEPMGYMLVNERMLESYVYARKFLRKGGRMFPSKADLHIALFSDDALFQEQQQRAVFWSQSAFHGVALDSLQRPAVEELFKQPVVDSWSTAILMSTSAKWTFDFEQDPVERLHNIQVPFTLCAQRTAYVHGVASWFDVAFIGGNRTVWLSTAPTEPLTHWYQVRCMAKHPILAVAGQNVSGSLTMVANDKQSYDLELEMGIEGIEKRQHNTLDLKTPHFRYTGQPVTMPPGQQTECPSDQLNQAILLNDQQQHQMQTVTAAAASAVLPKQFSCQNVFDATNVVVVGGNNQLLTNGNIPHPADQQQQMFGNINNY